jgi:hypothetical protein
MALNMACAVITAVITAVVEAPLEQFRHNSQAGNIRGNFVREMWRVRGVACRCSNTLGGHYEVDLCANLSYNNQRIACNIRTMLACIMHTCLHPALVYDYTGTAVCNPHPNSKRSASMTLTICEHSFITCHLQSMLCSTCSCNLLNAYRCCAHQAPARCTLALCRTA